MRQNRAFKISLNLLELDMRSHPISAERYVMQCSSASGWFRLVCCGSPAFPFAKAVKETFQFRKLPFQLSHCISKKGSNISVGFPVVSLVLGEGSGKGRKWFVLCPRTVCCPAVSSVKL